jgi:hypothetical protein
MYKPKSKPVANTRNCSLPKAPWLYLNDTTSDGISGDAIANNLISLIPKAVISTHLSAGDVPKVTSPEDTIVVFVDHQLDESTAAQTADTLREKTIELGKNFTSVNLTRNSSAAEHVNKVDWGTNHLEVNTTHRTAPAAAEKIFKWLCKLTLSAQSFSFFKIAAPALQRSLVIYRASADHIATQSKFSLSQRPFTSSLKLTCLPSTTRISPTIPTVPLTSPTSTARMPRSSSSLLSSASPKSPPISVYSGGSLIALVR